MRCTRACCRPSTQSGTWSRGWELRAATDLARFLAAEGRISDAGALLQPILDKFDEALDTEDLKIAGGVLP